MKKSAAIVTESFSRWKPILTKSPFEFLALLQNHAGLTYISVGVQNSASFPGFS